MGVKVANLWGDAKFQSLSSEAKLLYLYLANNPHINTVGVLCLNLDVICLELSYTIDMLRSSTQEIVNSKYCHVKKVDGLVYYIIPAHFKSVPKSQTTIKKVQGALDSLPEELVSFLKSIGIEAGAKVVNFNKPTPEEVSEYALSLGYNVNGKDFVQYYEDQAERYGKTFWVDGRGTQVKDWKAKLRRIWFKEENKIKAIQGAPEGFESFHVMFEGKTAFPDSWKSGKPQSKNIALDMKLKQEYEERKRGS